MALCGQNLGSKFAYILVLFVLKSKVKQGFSDYADEVQHGGFEIEDWFLGDENQLVYSDINDNKPWVALGHLDIGVAKSDLLDNTDVNQGNTLERTKHARIFDNKNLALKSASKPFHRELNIVEKRSPNNLLDDIPLNSIVFIELDKSKQGLSSKQKHRLIQALADALHLEKNHISLDDQILSKDNTLAVYAIAADADPEFATVDDLIPAEQLKNLIVSDLHVKLPDIKIQNIYTTVSVNEMLSSSHTDFATFGDVDLPIYLPYIIACAGVIFITLVISLTWYCAFRRHSKSSQYELSASSSHVPQQICTLFPAGKPGVHNPTAIQPNVSHVLTSRSAMGGLGSPLHGSLSPMTGSISPRSVMSGTPCSSPSSGTPLTGSSTPIHTPPMKIRAKMGLLERRGSNASLTIDLAPQSSQDTGSSWGSPPRESSAKEYLLSAGNRMSRKQLRNCLKNVRAIHEEFWEIPMNHPDRIEVAGSGMKNRYRTIIPNEETRVKLCDAEDDSISSYINANYIRGYGSAPSSYIATQGPMSNTVGDFWLMVWREKAPIIVMITKLREKNRTKCESYLPEITTKFGDIEVTTNNISERNGYILRNLTLKCGGKEHKVSHYWYTAWPDHKAPNTAKTLLDLIKLVDQQRYDAHTGKVTGPVVVHCSAGIGRTGCFIAASIGIQQLRCEHMVDVLGTVCSMRLDRGGMIQTNEQYEFLHQILCLFERELPERPPSDGGEE